MKSDLERRRLGAGQKSGSFAVNQVRDGDGLNPDEYLRDWGEIRVLG